MQVIISEFMGTTSRNHTDKTMYETDLNSLFTVLNKIKKMYNAILSFGSGTIQLVVSTQDNVTLFKQWLYMEDGQEADAMSRIIVAFIKEYNLNKK